MAGLLHNILRRSRGTTPVLGPRNSGIFEPTGGLSQLNLSSIIPKSTTARHAHTPRPQESLRQQTESTNSEPHITKKPISKEPQQPTPQNIRQQPRSQTAPYPQQFEAPDRTGEPLNTSHESTKTPQTHLPKDTVNKVFPEPDKEPSQTVRYERPDFETTEFAKQPLPPDPKNHANGEEDLDAKLSHLLQRIETVESGPRPTRQKGEGDAISKKEEQTTEATQIRQVQPPEPSTKAIQHSRINPATLPPLPKVKTERPAPSIAVSIGSIEFVEAGPPVQPATPTPRQTRRPTPNLTLSQYLNHE